jgi:DNA-binding NtrC family response regulator
MSNWPKVLVVDNDKNILSVFRDFLDKEHCNLIPATCITEAIMNLEQSRIDLLIVDVNFKDQLSRALFKRVKELQKNLPIIIITSYTDLIEEKDARKYGADYFFPKPLELNKLRGAVRKCLQLENSF